MGDICIANSIHDTAERLCEILLMEGVLLNCENPSLVVRASKLIGAGSQMTSLTCCLSSGDMPLKEANLRDQGLLLFSGRERDIPFRWGASKFATRIAFPVQQRSATAANSLESFATQHQDVARCDSFENLSQW